MAAGDQIIEVPGMGPVAFPAGMSEADIVSAIKRNSAPAKQPNAVQFGPASMAQSLQQELAGRGGVEQALAGVGTSVNDAAMRLKQLFGQQLAPQETADIQAGRQLRQVSAPAMFGGIGGQMAMTYPIAPATLLGNVAAGGAMGGLMEPVLPGESTGSNVARGAAGGGIGYGLVKGVSGVASAAANTAPVRSLLDEGIVPTVGQALRSTKTMFGKAAGGIEDAATSIPVIGDIIKGARGRGFEDVQRAALARATPAGTAATQNIGRQGLDETYNAISDAYRVALDRIGTVRLDQQFLDSAPQIVQRAVALNPSQRADVSNVVEQIVSSRVNPAGGEISAQVAKTIDSDLGTYARSYANSALASERQLGQVVGEVQKSWRDLIRRNAPDAATAAQLDDANRAFANYKRVERATAKGTTTGGEFSPHQLSLAVREMSPTQGSYARGGALMQDLSDPAAQVLTGRLGESGTIPRGILVGALLGGTGALANEKLGGPDVLTNAMLIAAGLGPLYTKYGTRFMLGDLPGQAAIGALAPYAGRAGTGYLLNRQ